MSWKHSGQLLKGPPTSSNSNRLDPRYRPNLGGLTAFQREQQVAMRYGPSEAGPSKIRTEWDVLKENHRFIRDDEEPNDVSWEERLARAYESKLFKEFALIDLKHYKSRRLALRWRTAPEVVEGIGEETCASLRCKYHRLPEPAPPSPRIGFSDLGPSISERGDDVAGRRYSNKRGEKRRRKMPALRSFELPFVYEEVGERKEALVKVKLCPKCQAKLTWKPGKESASESEDEVAESRSERRRDDFRIRDGRNGGRRERCTDEGDDRAEDGHRSEQSRKRHGKEGDHRRRDRRRSRSPRR